MASGMICEVRQTARERLSYALAAMPQLDRVECVSGGDQLPASHLRSPADVVLVGAAVIGQVGAQFAAACPGAVVVVYGTREELRSHLPTLNGAGVHGFLRWDPAEARATPAPSGVNAPVISKPRASATRAEGEHRFGLLKLIASVSLTGREYQVLVGMVHGKSNYDIARELFVSPYMAKSHAHRLFIKLGVSDRAAAVAQASA